MYFFVKLEGCPSVYQQQWYVKRKNQSISPSNPYLVGAHGCGTSALPPCCIR